MDTLKENERQDSVSSLFQVDRVLESGPQGLALGVSYHRMKTSVVVERDPLSSSQDRENDNSKEVVSDKVPFAYGGSEIVEFPVSGIQSRIIPSALKGPHASCATYRAVGLRTSWGLHSYMLKRGARVRLYGERDKTSAEEHRIIGVDYVFRFGEVSVPLGWEQGQFDTDRRSRLLEINARLLKCFEQQSEVPQLEMSNPGELSRASMVLTACRWSRNSLFLLDNPSYFFNLAGELREVKSEVRKDFRNFLDRIRAEVLDCHKDYHNPLEFLLHGMVSLDGSPRADSLRFDTGASWDQLQKVAKSFVAFDSNWSRSFFVEKVVKLWSHVTDYVGLGECLTASTWPAYVSPMGFSPAMEKNLYLVGAISYLREEFNSRFVVVDFTRFGGTFSWSGCRLPSETPIAFMSGRFQVEDYLGSKGKSFWPTSSEPQKSDGADQRYSDLLGPIRTERRTAKDYFVPIRIPSVTGYNYEEFMAQFNFELSDHCLIIMEYTGFNEKTWEELIANRNRYYTSYVSALVEAIRPETVVLPMDITDPCALDLTKPWFGKIRGMNLVDSVAKTYLRKCVAFRLEWEDLGNCVKDPRVTWEKLCARACFDTALACGFAACQWSVGKLPTEIFPSTFEPCHEPFLYEFLAWDGPEQRNFIEPCEDYASVVGLPWDCLENAHPGELWNTYFDAFAKTKVFFN